MRNWFEARARYLKSTLKVRTHRVYHALIPILQASCAAGLAWVVALYFFPGTKPFFAPISAIIALAPVPGRRVKRSLEIASGTVAGVLVGELIIARIGSGAWQIAFVVAIAMIAALFLGSGMLVTVQAASSAILIATLIPVGSVGGLQRVWHAVIGSLIGIIIMVVIPANPMRDIRRRLSDILQVESDVLRDVSEGLSTGNAELIGQALALVRATQPSINGIRETLYNGSEVVKLSPFLWHRKDELHRWEDIVEPLDNAIRNTRVLTRRALVIVEDDVIVDARIPEAILLMSEAAQVVHSMMSEKDHHNATQTEAARAVISVAMRTSFIQRDDDEAGMHGVVLHAQIRSTLIDLLQVCGLDRTSAVASIPPIEGSRFHPA